VTVSTPREWWRPEVAGWSADSAPTSAPSATGPAADSAVPFWALIAFTSVMLLAPQNYFPVLSAIRIAFLAAGLAIGAYVYDRLRRAQPLMLRAPEIRGVGYLLAWAVATIPLGSWPGGSVGVLLDLYSKTVAIFLLIANTVNTPSRLRIIITGLTLMAGPIAFTFTTSPRAVLIRYEPRGIRAIAAASIIPRVWSVSGQCTLST